jgi:hypothetical protein
MTTVKEAGSTSPSPPSQSFQTESTLSSSNIPILAQFEHIIRELGAQHRYIQEKSNIFVKVLVGSDMCRIKEMYI